MRTYVPTYNISVHLTSATYKRKSGLCAVRRTPARKATNENIIRRVLLLLFFPSVFNRSRSGQARAFVSTRVNAFSENDVANRISAGYTRVNGDRVKRRAYCVGTGHLCVVTLSYAIGKLTAGESRAFPAGLVVIYPYGRIVFDFYVFQ